jgi:hypothetical protein
MIPACVSGTDDNGDGAALGRMLGIEMECSRVTEESERTRLIADIMRLLREPALPEHARTAGMTLIGWLARRMPHEAPHAIGIEEARESERRIRAARKMR